MPKKFKTFKSQNSVIKSLAGKYNNKAVKSKKSLKKIKEQALKKAWEKYKKL